MRLSVNGHIYVTPEKLVIMFDTTNTRCVACYGNETAYQL